jgi:hypothetical protein
MALFGLLGTLERQRTLLALFFLQLLAAQEFDKCGVGAVALSANRRE